MIAGLSIFFYTLFGSLPLLLIVVSLGEAEGQVRTLALSRITIPLRIVDSLIIRAAFMIKLPIYIRHIWLPKAHVEAPVVGSILLAGLILKLGGVGLFYINGLVKGGGLMLIIRRVTVAGGAVIAAMVIRTRDIKVIIAISSVVHIRLVCLGAYS